MTRPRSPLERRYRRLLRAYPARYRAEHGEAIVGTYLDLAEPRRRRPGIADARDVLVSGLRQRLRGSRSTRFAAGVPVAAGVALCAAVGLAAVWLLWIELRPFPDDWANTRFGPFQSVGALAWFAWLGAGVAAVGAPGRTARRAILAALAATLATIPVAAFSVYDRPPLLVLVPQAALGVVAAGWPNRPGWSVRAAPVVVGAAAVVAAAGTARDPALYWMVGREEVLAGCAGLLLVGGFGAAAFRRFVRRRKDGRGRWAVLVLLPAAASLLVGPTADALAKARGTGTGTGHLWPTYATVTAAIAIAAAVGLPLAARRSGRAST